MVPALQQQQQQQQHGYSIHEDHFLNIQQQAPQQQNQGKLKFMKFLYGKFLREFIESIHEWPNFVFLCKKMLINTQK